jgi:uncharacterized SAM-binding protein YcdF (DUF218 family)
MPDAPNKTHYDAIIVLGSKPNAQTLKFPSHIYAALDAAAELYNTGATDFIVLSGNYALRYDRDNVQPPFRECDAMASYLLEHHQIPKAALLLEDISKDTVANFYYTKVRVLVPHQLRHLLFIAADFRIERQRFLATKVMGSDYTIAFKAVPSQPDEVNPTEHIVMQRTQDFLAPMPDGDDSFLASAFYTHDFYKRPR